MKEFKSLSDKLREHFENMTEEEIEADRLKYFPESTTPKGWVSIEDDLPKMMAIDILQGCSEYKVKFLDGMKGISCVADHNTWYYYAKQVGITHWFNE